MSNQIEKVQYSLRDTPTEEPKFVVEKEKGCGVITPVATDTLDLIRFAYLFDGSCILYLVR